MNSDTPLVSVMMLTYNHEKYIAQAIDSVLMQKTDFPFELIIGEDCSTDGTRAIVDEYERKSPDIIRVVSGPTNMGALANILRINAASRGKYIATLEGDDYWNDELKLKKQVDLLEQHPDYGLVHSDIDHWYEEKQILIKSYNAHHHIQIPEGYVYEELLDPDKYMIKTPSALFRKELHDRHVDYEVIRKHGWVVADLFTWLSMARYAKYKYFPESMATYRVYKKSMSNSSNYISKNRIHQSVFGIRNYFIEKYPGNEKLFERIIRRHISTVLFDAFKIPDETVSESIREFANAHQVKFGLKDKLLYWGVKSRLVRGMIEWNGEFFKRKRSKLKY